MEATIYIEIPIKISFSVDPGQMQTCTDPGYPPQIEDIDFDDKKVIEAVNTEIFGEKSTIDEDLMNEAIEQKKAKQEDYGDMKYEQSREALWGIK